MHSCGIGVWVDVECLVSGLVLRNGWIWECTYWYQMKCDFSSDGLFWIFVLKKTIGTTFPLAWKSIWSVWVRCTVAVWVSYWESDGHVLIMLSIFVCVTCRGFVCVTSIAYDWVSYASSVSPRVCWMPNLGRWHAYLKFSIVLWLKNIISMMKWIYAEDTNRYKNTLLIKHKSCPCT